MPDLNMIIVADAKAAQRAGRKFDTWNRILWWLSVGCIWLGVAIGFASRIPSTNMGFVEPWMISAISSLGAGFEVIRRRVGWEKLGQAYWSKWVELNELMIDRDFVLPDDQSLLTKTVAGKYKDICNRFGDARNQMIAEREKTN
jgi:hypothetical protein